MISDYSDLVKTTVDPELSTQVVKQLASKRDYSPEELNDFKIYLRDDDTEGNYDDGVFLVQQLLPQMPYDLGYIMVMSASQSAQLAATQAGL